MYSYPWVLLIFLWFKYQIPFLCVVVSVPPWPSQYFSVPILVVSQNGDLFFSRWCTQNFFCFYFFPTLREMSFIEMGKNVLCLLTNKMWDWVSEGSFRKTVESYTGLGLIRRLISAHLRSHRRSNRFFYHAFALVRDSSIILCKLNHCDWPTLLARGICVLLPLSSCQFWYKLGWWMSSPAGHMPHM